MDSADFIIIGGGIAGLSAGARLAGHGKVVVLEGEEALGYHSSGRSVSFSHYGIGNAVVRALTHHSRPFFEAQPEGFCDTPVAALSPSLYFAEEGALPLLEALETNMAALVDTLEPLDAGALTRLCPVIRTGPGAAVRGFLDPTGLKLDADALLQSFARQLRARGGEIRLGHQVGKIERNGEAWVVDDTVAAPVLVNAAGAWCDRIAALAGVTPLGLEPKRRTIIAVDPGMDMAGWPFVHSAAGDFYMLPEAGRLLVSPVDEVADDPCDAQPDDYDIAFAADRLEHYTTLKVTRIAHRWAGLRTFTPDRTPTTGFAPDAPGFLWLCGQGGYGLQTGPAMAEALESLAAGTAWPFPDVTPAQIAPDRLLAR
ncbi:MAG TPA: FAD-dependent oxidoreductase [Allosphingosinicella sp.]|nr:FAD-dependent oxidoreductase [Allosphingosinicella sp.]